jgi:TolB-like protein
MISRLIILCVMQISLLFSQTQIAVVDFEGLDVSENEARALTNRLMIEMHRTNKFVVLERGMLDKIIEEQKFQLSGCNADQCLVELGEIANVQQIVGGSVSKVGDVYTITARLISVESGEVVESALYDYEGKIGALMKVGMSIIASQLAAIPSPVDDIMGTQKVETPANANDQGIIPKHIDGLGFEVRASNNFEEAKLEILGFSESLVISSIDTNCDAFKKGELRVGQIILRVASNGRNLPILKTPSEFYDYFNNSKSNEKFTLLVQGDNLTRSVVTLRVQ